MAPLYHVIIPSPLGELGLLWEERAGMPRVLRTTLPGKASQLKDYPRAAVKDHPEMAALAADLRRFLAGEEVRFDLQRLAWEGCTDFQAQVLRAEAGIPRGFVSTYGRIATHLGRPRASRAVGAALAANPFPILIPCHRAVRSTGELGGYQGGLAMKRTLLEMEGVKFIFPGKVSMKKVYY